MGMVEAYRLSERWQSINKDVLGKALALQGLSLGLGRNVGLKILLFLLVPSRGHTEREASPTVYL